MATFVYIPVARRVIAITKSYPALITTSEPHGYNDGLIVRFFIPYVYESQVVDGIVIQGFGMREINNLQGVVNTTDDPAVFAVTIDTTNFEPFVIPPNQDIPNTQVQYAQVIPAGTTINAQKNAYRDILPL